MLRWGYWVFLILIILVVNLLIVNKEKTLTVGQPILMSLTPDGRSYEMEDQIPLEGLGTKGALIVTLDQNNVASFKRMDQGEPIQKNEFRLIYRKRHHLQLGAAPLKEVPDAAYALLVADPSGRCILKGFCDAERKMILNYFQDE